MKKLAGLLFVLFTLPLTAQEISVVNGSAPETATLARPFTLTYSVVHDAAAPVQLAEDSLSPDFDIQKKATSNPKPTTTVFDLTVFPFALGKSTFTATFVSNIDGKAVSQQAKPIYITVKPASTFKDKKLREIRAPHAPNGLWKWLLVVLAVFALLYILYLWRRKLQEDPYLRLQQQEDHRPADEIALSKIDALINSGLWEGRQYKVFYITLSDILREYLWRRFELDASADTSADLLRHAKYKQHLLPLLYPLKDLLTSMDLVKFAKVVPEESVRNKDIQILREIITETSPKEIAGEEKKA